MYSEQLKSETRETSNLYWVVYPEKTGASNVPPIALTITCVLSNSSTQ